MENNGLHAEAWLLHDMQLASALIQPTCWRKQRPRRPRAFRVRLDCSSSLGTER